MVSFENFVKLMLPSLSELKVTPSFCFTFKTPDDVAASTVKSTVQIYTVEWMGRNFDVFPGLQKIPCYGKYYVIQYSCKIKGVSAAAGDYCA